MARQIMQSGCMYIQWIIKTIQSSSSYHVIHAYVFSLCYSLHALFCQKACGTQDTSPLPDTLYRKKHQQRKGTQERSCAFSTCTCLCVAPKCLKRRRIFLSSDIISVEETAEMFPQCLQNPSCVSGGILAGQPKKSPHPFLFLS